MKARTQNVLILQSNNFRKGRERNVVLVAISKNPWCLIQTDFLQAPLSQIVFYEKGTRRFTQARAVIYKNMYINYLMPHSADILPIALIDHKNGNAMVSR